jgi:hypothetical protein
MRSNLALTLVLGLVACGKSKDATGDQPAPAPKTVTAGTAGSGSAADPGKPATNAKLEAARCDEPCLFLTDTPIAQLADTFQAKCAGKDAKAAAFESCTQVDYARNCVYAAHGVVPKKGRYKKAFEAKAWYEPHPEVTAKTLALGAIEHANVHELYMRGKACKKNMDLTGADYERVKKWFAALPKAPVPKIAAHWEDGNMEPPASYDTVGAKDFLDWLNGALPEAKQRLKSGKEINARYRAAEDVQRDAALLAAVHASDPSKLRVIDIDFEGEHGTEEDPFTSGVKLTFVYGDGDKLVALIGSHYAFD